MDELIKQGQWWWLVSVPVLTGVFALFGSWWGSKLGKNTEHWQWLRNEKQKEYIAAVDKMGEMTSTLADLVQEKPTSEVSGDNSFITPIIVLGPRRVKKSMKAVMSQMHETLEILHEAPSDTRLKRAQDAHGLLAENYDKFLADVRRDLGVKD
ncbi:hypothetical protein ACSVHC_18130 [Arthrobacter sp. KNU-44]|uniref:hypothetical protein n=1 Tax=Arthrobacter sp. KNU-44 TaxID=3450744 RepID=UPI003F43349B